MNKVEAIEFVEKTLHERGIDLWVDGCGCCGSPSVRASIDGVLVLDDDDVCLEGNSMYCITNFKTKKALKEAVKAAAEPDNEAPHDLGIFQPGPFGGREPTSGRVAIEGPHGYHRWYAECMVKDGQIVSVK